MEILIFLGINILISFLIAKAGEKRKIGFGYFSNQGQERSAAAGWYQALRKKGAPVHRPGARAPAGSAGAPAF